MRYVSSLESCARNTRRKSCGLVVDMGRGSALCHPWQPQIGTKRPSPESLITLHHDTLSKSFMSMLFVVLFHKWCFFLCYSCQNTNQFFAGWVSMDFKRGGILCHFMHSFGTLSELLPLKRENNDTRNISSADYLSKCFSLYLSEPKSLLSS